VLMLVINLALLGRGALKAHSNERTE
jgi:hypothetical protein